MSSVTGPGKDIVPADLGGFCELQVRTWKVTLATKDAKSLVCGGHIFPETVITY